MAGLRDVSELEKQVVTQTSNSFFVPDFSFLHEFSYLQFTVIIKLISSITFFAISYARFT